MKTSGTGGRSRKGEGIKRGPAVPRDRREAGSDRDIETRRTAGPSSAATDAWLASWKTAKVTRPSLRSPSAAHGMVEGWKFTKTTSGLLAAAAA